MNTSSAVPSDHPLMLAWEAYKLTEDFANSRRWAAHAEHVDGSLWAAFVEGWNRRAPAQPEPAAPTPDTFMGEPVLTRWKPLNRDDSRLALHQSMHNRSFGNPSDDKLMLEWLWENGYALCKRVPTEAAPTVVEPLHVDESKRYRVVQKGYWWRVQIGDGQQTVGRCFSQTEAQQLAHALLVAYRDGAFVASRATPPRAALTDEQLKQILMDHPGPITQGWFYNFARAVIAADRGEK